MADQIIENLWLGDWDDAHEVCSKEFDHILNVLCKVNPDFETGKVDVSILEGLAWLILEKLNNNEKLLVHCKAGMERSPLVVAWYLWKYEDFRSLDDAYRYIKSKRQCVRHCGHWLDWREVHG